MEERAPLLNNSTETGTTEDKAQFSLTTAPDNDQAIRSDERKQFSFKLDREGARDMMHRQACCCCCVLMTCCLPWNLLSCCLLPLCFVKPLYDRGNSFLNAQFFVTDQAIHFDNTYTSSCCTCNMIGGNGESMRKVRLPFDKIRSVETPAPGFCCCNSCFYDPYTHDGEYGTLGLTSTDRNVYVTRDSKGHTRTHVQDSMSFTFPLVYHHEDVAKSLRFIHDATDKGTEVDWDHMKREMRDYLE